MTDLHGKRILLADDDPDLRNLLREIFEDLGVEWTEVVDGEEALRVAQEKPFDLILLDVMLPFIDGYRVATELTAKLGERCPKILIITCRDLTREAPLAVMSGAVATLQKPFMAKDILEKVSDLLG